MSSNQDEHPACACDDPQFKRQIQGLKDVTTAINEGLKMANTDIRQVHVISYAYPSSDDAVRHKHGRQGCFILKAPNVDEPFPTLEMAMQFASTLGTVPSRYSFDHPSRNPRKFARLCLANCGWKINLAGIIPRKSIMTAAGEKEAYAYFTDDGLNEYLSARHVSKGLDILESISVHIPAGSSDDCIRYLIERFVRDAEKTVSEYYASQTSKE